MLFTKDEGTVTLPLSDYNALRDRASTLERTMRDAVHVVHSYTGHADIEIDVSPWALQLRSEYDDLQKKHDDLADVTFDLSKVTCSPMSIWARDAFKKAEVSAEEVVGSNEEVDQDAEE